LNIKALRLFVSLMENVTLARAAEDLHTSQPAASRSIRLLEEQVGEALFRRAQKRLIPTVAAETFLPEAIRILRSIDNIPELFAHSRSRAARPLRILCLPRIVNALVLPAIAELHRAGDGVRIKIEVCPRRDFGRRLQYGSYDVGVSSLPIPPGLMQATVLVTASLHVMVHARHRLVGRSRVDVADLAGDPYIALDEHTVVRQAVDHALAAAGAHLDVTHEVSTSEVATQMVRAGMGFTVVDPASLGPLVGDGVAIVPWSIPASFEIGYVLPPAAPPHPARDAFVAFLQSVGRDRYPSGTHTA
jgi:DNA-binding transcriptional LysR family regulator